MEGERYRRVVGLMTLMSVFCCVPAGPPPIARVSAVFDSARDIVPGAPVSLASNWSKAGHSIGEVGEVLQEAEGVRLAMRIREDACADAGPDLDSCVELMRLLTGPNGNRAARARIDWCITTWVTIQPDTVVFRRRGWPEEGRPIFYHGSNR